jgi:transposase InsO family protein
VLQVSDLNPVSTWTDFVDAAFTIDVCALCVVGWRVSTTAHASFDTDALAQALHACRPASRSGLVPH